MWPTRLNEVLTLAIVLALMFGTMLYLLFLLFTTPLPSGAAVPNYAATPISRPTGQ